MKRKDKGGKTDRGELYRGGEAVVCLPSLIALAGGSEPALFSCPANTHTHTYAQSTCVHLIDSSFITINQLQPALAVQNPPTAGGKGGRERREERGDRGQWKTAQKDKDEPHRV